MSAPRFDALIAVGDNLSLDPKSAEPLTGAASLLHRNRDADWPEFKGRDMVTRDPAIRLLNLAQDGATTLSTLDLQMKRVPPVDEPVLVIVTVGMWDLLALAGAPGVRGVENADGLYDAITSILDNVLQRLADGHVLLSNIPAAPDAVADLLDEFNATIADIAREQGAPLADLRAHFAGHEPNTGDEAWLAEDWSPTRRGASEIRRMLWQSLRDI